MDGGVKHLYVQAILGMWILNYFCYPGNVDLKLLLLTNPNPNPNPNPDPNPNPKNCIEII